MSLKVIELNDNAIRVGDESGILIQSPGFALALGDTLKLGEEAQQQARIHPTSSYNKYWHELSVEPISHANGIRHLADIAYAQLLHLASVGEIDSDVIFAVPGNFTPQQLSILLGLAKQSPFKPVGMVDLGLAAGISSGLKGSLVYADIQLHQVVLTKLVTENNGLKVDSVIQVPGVGSQHFMDLMMQLATGLFIQQCRFNPQHDAESEQQLYNALPHWLQENAEDKSSLLLELRTSSAVHTAKMPRESLINKLTPYYQNIEEQIAALAAGEPIHLLLNGELAQLPGFTASLSPYEGHAILDPNSVNATCHNYQDYIVPKSDEIHLVNSLPLQRDIPQNVVAGQNEPKQSSRTDRVTHLLFQNRAIAINRVEIRNNGKLNGNAADSIMLSLADLPAQLGQFEKHDQDVYLDSGEQEFLLNRSPVSGRHKLSLGDHIQFSENSDEILLIQVHDGE